MPGGCSADITHQTLTDYYVRLMRYMDYVKRTVPMHDYWYYFFLQQSCRADHAGYRATNLVNWGCFYDPDYVDYDYKRLRVGPAPLHHAGHRDQRRAGHHRPGRDQPDDPHPGWVVPHFDGWENEPTFVTHDPLGNPVDKNHPWNKQTLPKPQKRDFADKYSWGRLSPRIFDKRTGEHVCCDTGGGPFARQWCTAKAGIVDFGYLKATGESIQMVLPKSAALPEMELEWEKVGESRTPSSATAPGPTTRPTRRLWGCTAWSAR